MTNESGKSDRLVVPEKPPNKAERTAAERVEGSGRAKGNSQERNALRTQGRDGAQSALERVRKAAREDRNQRFTALLHHVTVDLLRAAYWELNPRAATGVDGVTWQEYGLDL